MQLSFTVTVAVVAVPHTLIDKSTMILLMMFTSSHLNQAVAPQTPAMAVTSHANFPSGGISGVDQMGAAPGHLPPSPHHTCCREDMKNCPLFVSHI